MSETTIKPELTIRKIEVELLILRPKVQLTFIRKDIVIFDDERKATHES